MFSLAAGLDVDEGKMLQPVPAAGNYRFHIGIGHPADPVVGRVGNSIPGNPNLSRVAGVFSSNIAGSRQVALGAYNPPPGDGTKTNPSSPTKTMTAIFMIKYQDQRNGNWSIGNLNQV